MPSYVVLRQSPHCICFTGGTSLNSVALKGGVDLAGLASRRFETCTYAPAKLCLHFGRHRGACSH